MNQCVIYICGEKCSTDIHQNCTLQWVTLPYGIAKTTSMRGDGCCVSNLTDRWQHKYTAQHTCLRQSETEHHDYCATSTLPIQDKSSTALKECLPTF